MLIKFSIDSNNGFKEFPVIEQIKNIPDITTEQAEKLRKDVLEEMAVLKNELQQIQHLQEYVSFKNDKHNIPIYLAHNIHNEILFWHKYYFESIKEKYPNKSIDEIKKEVETNIKTLSNGKFVYRSFEDIYSDIHEQGVLKTFFEWEGHLTFTVSKKYRYGSMFLLFELAQIYKRLNTTGGNTKKQPGNLWLISDEEKHKIYIALNKEKILKYSGEGKPIISMKNVIPLFKTLHELQLIDESLIYNKSITKKETWKPDFIISEFVKESNRKDSTDFNDVNIKDGKRDFYTNINNRENIEKIKSIIQSALTA